MSLVTTEAVQQMKNAVDEVCIYANEGDIYTVGITVGKDKMTVCDKANKPLVFHSLALAKAAFKSCSSAKTSVICANPYDEMIGHEHNNINTSTGME